MTLFSLIPVWADHPRVRASVFWKEGDFLVLRERAPVRGFRETLRNLRLRPGSAQFLRVLKTNGTFILNIKEKVVDSERHTYVIELIMALRKQGWLWTEEFIWHKRNCHPGKWPNRFRDAWERCLQFNKSKKFQMFQESVMVPMGKWAETRLKHLGKHDVIRFDSKVGSGFGKNIANWIGRDKAYPSNVLHLATETDNRNHSATFPRALPESSCSG